MYLHLGADCMVKNSEIVAIINLCHPQSEACQEYVEKYKDAYKLVDATEGGEASSLVLTEDTLYLSAISSLTLKKRASDIWLEDAAYTR